MPECRTDSFSLYLEDVMPQLKYLALACIALLLSACQTVSLYKQDRHAFTDPQDKGHSVIRVAGFQIPKDEPGTTLMLVLAAAGGADIHAPTGASIFDITEETRYLGTLWISRYGDGFTHWLEASVPPGKRRLMLALAGKGSILGQVEHTDFIEVDVAPGGVTHAVLSRHGFLRHPYLGEVDISDEDRARCSAFAGNRRERASFVEKYMAERQISPYANDFKAFCLLLSDPKTIQEPNDESLKQVEQSRERIESLRTEGYGKWRSEAEKRVPYDLMRIYEPPSLVTP